MKKKIIVTAVAMGMLLSVGSVTVFAAENSSSLPVQPALQEISEIMNTEQAEVTTAYSYTAGQQRSQSRNDVYAQAETIESEEEKEAFLNEQGIGEIEWSEDSASSYSYVGGRQRGASFRTDDTDDEPADEVSSYSYVTGQQRGSGYQR